MSNLVSRTRCDEVDELKRRILAQARVIAWMEQLVLVYDSGDWEPSDPRLYHVVAGAAVSYFRGVAYKNSVTNAVDRSIQCLLQDLWYETVAGEVRCIQKHNSQVGRRSILQRAIERASERLQCDFTMLACRIGHSTEMNQFKNEVAEATGEVLANVQMLYRSLYHKSWKLAQATSGQSYLRLIIGGRKEPAPLQPQLRQFG